MKHFSWVNPHFGVCIFTEENFCDPKGIQFEPLLAHFEQLRQMYEMMEKEENDV